MKQFFCDEIRLPLCTGVAVDTRKIKWGNIFFALEGAQTDGHHFLQEAALKRASLLVVKKSYQGKSDFSCPLIRVEDPLHLLQRIAKVNVDKLQAITCAITGSFGKTTTKEFLVQLVSPHRKVLATSGSQNSQIGFPLSLLNNIEHDESICIVEMGLTEKGHIQKLVDIVPPDIGVITALAPVHIAQFNTMRDLAAAKMEIFSNPKTKVGLISKECMEFPYLVVEEPRKQTFSMNDAEVDWHLSVEKDCMVVQHQGTHIRYPKVVLPTAYFYHNLLAAIACAKMVGLSWAEIENSLPKLTLPERRFQEIVKQGICFIDDAYNAGEDSTVQALKAVAQRTHQGRKIAVLGELSELDALSEEVHRRIGLCALECVEDVICFGKGCQPIVEAFEKQGKKVTHFFEMNEMIAHLLQELGSGDLVLLKGSRGNRLERILEAF